MSNANADNNPDINQNTRRPVADWDRIEIDKKGKVPTQNKPK